MHIIDTHLAIVVIAGRVQRGKYSSGVQREKYSSERTAGGNTAAEYSGRNTAVRGQRREYSSESAAVNEHSRDCIVRRSVWMSWMSRSSK